MDRLGLAGGVREVVRIAGLTLQPRAAGQATRKHVRCAFSTGAAHHHLGSRQSAARREILERHSPNRIRIDRYYVELSSLSGWLATSHGGRRFASGLEARAGQNGERERFTAAVNVETPHDRTSTPVSTLLPPLVIRLRDRLPVSRRAKTSRTSAHEDTRG